MDSTTSTYHAGAKIRNTFLTLYQSALNIKSRLNRNRSSMSHSRDKARKRPRKSEDFEATDIHVEIVFVYLKGVIPTEFNAVDEIDHATVEDTLTLDKVNTYILNATEAPAQLRENYGLKYPDDVIEIFTDLGTGPGNTVIEKDRLTSAPPDLTKSVRVWSNVEIHDSLVPNNEAGEEKPKIYICLNYGGSQN